MLSVGAPLKAATLDWAYNPPAAARVLYSGGWTVPCNLGNVNVTPEFGFPLQLVYFTGRENDGLFGSQWFCPQLESSLLPVAKGYLLWTTPAGQQILLEQDVGGQRGFRSQDRLWRAGFIKGRYDISNQDGWHYQYVKGRLVAVISPTRRMLEFEWRKRFLDGVRLKDSGAAGHLLLLHLVYGPDERVSGLKLKGQAHKFAYTREGTCDRLTAWAPPSGDAMRFQYHPETGVLWKCGFQNASDSDSIDVFKTRFVDPVKNGTLADEFASKRRPVNHWLVEDSMASYSYGLKPDPADRNKRQLNQADITVTHRSGLVEKSDYAANRGLITGSRAGVERKTYYFRSPGQSFDGKLRRIEENGKTVVDHRYDRKTGLLTETIDARGISTFFDYDPSARRVKGGDWDPKPLRVRRGNHAKSSIIAEYRYDKDGRVLAVKDGEGNVTRYEYTPRGELAAVVPPIGDRVEYEYDKFGRMVGANAGGRIEKAGYDETGRLASRTTPDGTRTEILYDADGRKSQVKRNGKVVKQLVRDGSKRVSGEKDALGRVSRMERDARGNLTASIAPNGAITRYEYDSSNRRTAQIDGNGNKITFEYDPAGHLVRQTNALGNTQTWKYDAKSGKLTERANGEQVIRHGYASTGDLASIDYGGGQKLNYTRDKEGRPLTVTGPDSSFEFSYDARGRALATRAIRGPDDYLLAYRHNLRGQRTGLLISRNPYPPDKTPVHKPIQQIEHLYDSTGRLTAILSNGMPAFSCHYDSAGRPARKTYGTPERGRPALTAEIAYDPAGRLARMTFQGGRLTSPLLLIHEWDDADQLTRRTWNGRTLRYEYDAAGQLLKATDESDQAVLEAYTYDPAGNMRTKFLHGHLTAMTYNAGNQLVCSYDLGPATPETLATLPSTPDAWPQLAKSSRNFQYDRAGRLLGTGSQPTHTYGWLDKLTCATLPDGSTATHTYWPDGQLAAISSSPPSTISNPQSSFTTETFLWDGLALIKRNDTIYLIEPHPSGGIPIASHPVGRPGEITYHLNDMLGTTLATVGPAGVNFTSLTSFGQPLKAATAIDSTSPSIPSAPANPVPSHNQLPPTRQ